MAVKRTSTSLKKKPTKRLSKVDLQNLKLESLKELDRELDHLRSTFRDSLDADAYRSSIEGELAQLTTTLYDSPIGMSREQETIINNMLLRIRQLEIKPQKGRRKTLKRIEKLTENLTSLTERWNWEK